MVGEPLAVIADWLTVAEVARQLSLSDRWTRTLIAREKFTAVHTHLGWLIDPHSVEEYKPSPRSRKRPTSA
jgi:excisionase family DNA binding protein